MSVVSGDVRRVVRHEYTRTRVHVFDWASDVTTGLLLPPPAFSLRLTSASFEGDDEKRFIVVKTTAARTLCLREGREVVAPATSRQVVMDVWVVKEERNNIRV